MGACNIELIKKGKLTKSEIKKAFKDQQKKDRLDNGTQSGYSGDFQTVGDIDYRLDELFSSRSEAEEFCLKNAVKWDTVVAVYFVNAKNETNTMLAGWGAC
jgi:hypothetical protein